MYFGSGSVTTYSDHGYGLYLNGTSTRLTDCTFIGNGAKISDEAPVASLRGGGRGVAIYATGAKVNAEKCIWNGGVLPIGDNSSPEEVHRLTQMSKKVFKRAVGVLMKRGDIVAEPTQIKLK